MAGSAATRAALPELRRTGVRRSRWPAIVRRMNPASTATPTLRPAWRAVVDSLTWKRAAVAALPAITAAAVLNPVFSVPFGVLLGRMVFIAALLLLVFGAAAAWHPSRHPSRLPSWLAQVLAVAFAAPVATLLAYLPSVGGDLREMLAHEGRLWGFIYITGTVLVVAPMVALGALYRERDAQARSAQLAFALERSTLEKEALDARLKLLQAQIEPLIRRPIRELADELDPDSFAQIHRSVIVNLRQVAQVDRGFNDTAEVRLKGRREVLSVSRSFLHVFRQM